MSSVDVLHSTQLKLVIFVQFFFVWTNQNESSESGDSDDSDDSGDSPDSDELDDSGDWSNLSDLVLTRNEIFDKFNVMIYKVIISFN